MGVKPNSKMLPNTKTPFFAQYFYWDGRLGRSQSSNVNARDRGLMMRAGGSAGTCGSGDSGIDPFWNCAQFTILMLFARVA